MKNIVLIGGLLMAVLASFSAGYDFRNRGNLLFAKPKPDKRSRGYTIIEAGKAINENNDTIYISNVHKLYYP